MLRIFTSSGSIEATAADEQRVRGLSDAEVCRQLNGVDKLDPFVIAELRERRHIQRYAYGWASRENHASSLRANHVCDLVRIEFAEWRAEQS
jgi:hypothetical protein